MELTDGDMSLIIGSRQGRALRIHESSIRVIGRTGMGVHAMKLQPGDELIDMSRLTDGQQILAITTAATASAPTPTSTASRAATAWASVPWRSPKRRVSWPRSWPWT